MATPPQDSVRGTGFPEIRLDDLADEFFRAKAESEEEESRPVACRSDRRSSVASYRMETESSRRRGRSVSRPPDGGVMDGKPTTGGNSRRQRSVSVARHRRSDSQDDASTECNMVGSNCVNDYTSEFTTDEIFKSREDLCNWCREAGRRNGFVIVIKTSDVGGNGRKPRIVLSCERGGTYRNTSKKNIKGQKEKRPKITCGTKKCGCPFALKGKKLDTEDDWMLMVVCGVHNHLAADHLEGHSYAGRLSTEETSLLVDMSKNLVRPKEILSTLKQKDALNVTTLKTIYNARHRCKAVEKAERSQIQQLLDKLVDAKYIKWHRNSNNTDVVMDLFWAHPCSINLLRAFPRILIMDCMYKTNRYCLSLLEIVGVTSTDMTFSIAFAYLDSEREDNYTWALERLRSVMDADVLPEIIITDRDLALMNAIEMVFPTARHLLCRWHIGRYILAKCKRLFETKEKWDKFIMSWNILVLSSTEDEYNDHLIALHREFSTYPDVLQYVSNSWLNKNKEKFVAAWTDTCMHYGNVTMNRVESAHAKLKRQLGSSQGTFESFWKKIHALIELQHTDIKASFEKSLTVVHHNFKPAEFKELRGFISISALNNILAQLKRSNLVGIDASACGCAIRRTHGLPCAHEIAQYKLEARPIPLDCIDPHWRKLDMVPATNMQSMKLSCEPELDLFAKRFNQLDGASQLQMLKKLREIISLMNTFIESAKEKTGIRCRIPSKVDTSTHHSPSDFELVLSGQDSYSPGVEPISTDIPMQSRQKKRPKEKVIRAHARQHLAMMYIDAFPDGLRPHIQHIKDVKADGNCAFRAIADLLGFGEDGWVQVRKDLLHELQSHSEQYYVLYGVEGRIDELTHALSHFQDCPPYDRWMTMPDMGHLVASCYNVVLYHLSLQQCLTFLPLRSVPLPVASRRHIALGFVNGNHFVEVFLLPGHPVPPIATNWRRYHHPCAEGWDSSYETRIQQFREVISPNVITSETVELD